MKSLTNLLSEVKKVDLSNIESKQFRTWKKDNAQPTTVMVRLYDIAHTLRIKGFNIVLPKTKPHQNKEVAIDE